MSGTVPDIAAEPPIAEAPVVAPVDGAPIPTEQPLAVEPTAAPATPTAAAEPPAAPAAPEAAPAPEAPPAAPPEQAALVPHTDTPTLLQSAGRTEEPAAPAAEPPAPAAPVYEAFKLPEGVSIEPEKLTGYTDILGKHGLPQEVGQELLNLYIAERQKDAVQTLAQQHQAFADMRKGWQDNVRTDPEIGGANFHTAMDAVATVRDRFIPQSGPIKEAFDRFMVTTGAGDHPEFLRFISRIGAAFREPAPPPPGRPPPDVGKRPAGRNGGAPLYDNPSSPQPRAM